tara:strand:- start:3960 stop:4460 length:501 start_codon:yes stop_codon:yes gene_type:complete
MTEIINKVAKSGIINISLEDYVPKDDIISFNLKQFLHNEEILVEKEFRTKVKSYNFKSLQNKVVGLFCDENIILPMWAFMLISCNLKKHNIKFLHGDKQTVFNTLWLKNIKSLDSSAFENKRVIVNGCGNIKASEEIYIAITDKLFGVAKSIMFGEACSSVPIYKQ